MRGYEQAKQLLLQFNEEQASSFIEIYKDIHKFEGGAAFAIVHFLMNKEETSSTAFKKYLEENPFLNDYYDYLHTEPIMLLLTRQLVPSHADDIEKEVKEKFTSIERLKIAAEQILEEKFFQDYWQPLHKSSLLNSPV